MDFDIKTGFILFAIGVVPVALFALWCGRQTASPLNRAEWAVAGKLLLVVAMIMMLICVCNAIDLPAGQFIYGRF